MEFTPLHDRVLVRRIEGEDKTKGGLIISWCGMRGRSMTSQGVPERFSGTRQTG